MKNLIFTILIALIVFFGCKKDKASLDTSLFDDDYYSAFVYRAYPNDLRLDTFTYHFNKDTLTVIGFTFDRVNNINTPIKKDSISHSFFIVNNTIWFPPQIESPYELSVNYNLVGPYEFHLLNWEVIEFDKSKLVIEGHTSDRVISHFELTANPKK